MGSVPFFFFFCGFQYSVFVFVVVFLIVIKCQFECVFLWSIYHGNLLGTNSPASGVMSISLEEKPRSFSLINCEQLTKFGFDGGKKTASECGTGEFHGGSSVM